MKNRFDLIVLGGGTGGYSAAFRGSELGLKTAIVERAKLGGTCLHSGCIPTKSLLHTAEILETMKRAPSFGIHFGEKSVVWEEVVSAKNKAVEEIYTGLRALAKGRGVEIVSGNAGLMLDDTLEVQEAEGANTYTFDKLVLATGSRPRIIPGLSVDDGPIITSDRALNLKEIPASVIILGGGYVGIEFASMWRSFGAEVSIVEMEPRLLPQEDSEIAELLAKALIERGIKLYLGSKFLSAKNNGQIIAEVKNENSRLEMAAEKLMVAVGRAPVTESFVQAGIKLAGGCVEVDEQLKTSRPNVYAVGDLLNTPQLAHAAFAEGIFVAEVIAGQNPEPINYDNVPHCVYSYPEVASVGLTESVAKDRGYDVVVARESFKSNAKAHISGEEAGEAKIVAQKDGGVLGVHLIGPKASELISEAMLVTGWEAEPADMAKLIHPHPTLSEIIGEGALKLAGKPLHSV